MVLTAEMMGEIRHTLNSLNPEEQQEKLQEILETLNPEEREQLVGKQQCPFCMIGEGKIPSTKVYEDTEKIAVLDINPATPGHTLLFTKKHYTKIEELNEDETAKLFKLAHRISKAIINGLDAKGITFHMGSGEGQTSPHLIINIIPRFENDGLRFLWQGKKQTDEERQLCGTKISENLKEEVPKYVVQEVVAQDDDEDYVSP